MADIAEFYSSNLANEVKKGLTQKARNGGTPGRAPIGYINIRARDASGREYRTVDVDPARAPLITWAFEAYATGQWTLLTLSDELALRGLATPPTPKQPSRAVSSKTLQKILRNPYYKGEIVYNGARHPGVHPPLVNPLLFHLVQDMLDAHNLAGQRVRTHDHYLKGSLYCQCGQKMMINLATNKKGETYPYFVCTGRHRKLNTCQVQAVLVTTVEKLVEDYYATIQISPEVCEALEDMIGEIFTTMDAASQQERADLAKRKEKLTGQQLKLLQSFYDDAITLPILRTEQQRIQDDLDQITSRLDAYAQGCADAKIRIRAYLAMATNSHSFYRSLDPANRRLCNQAFFTKIILHENRQVSHEFTGVYDTILDPTTRLHADYWQRNRQLHPAILQNQTDPDAKFGSGVRTSELWWSTGDSNP
jgi:hypothetical protein